VSNERVGFSANLPRNLPGGYFQLCGDSDFVRARHVGCTAASELPGTETSQNDELERGELSRTVYHGELSFVRLTTLEWTTALNLNCPPEVKASSHHIAKCT